MKRQTLPIRKGSSVCVLLIAVLIGIANAGYFQPDLFPVGLTGINYTGTYNCPFSNVDPYWTWSTERNLINELGINCIGCSDAFHEYLMNFTGGTSNYLHQICMTSYNPNRPNPIYILPNSYYAPRQYYDYRGDTLYDPLYQKPNAHFRANTLFRSPYRGGCSDPNKTHQAGYGASVFSPDCSVGGWQPWGTTSDANWNTCDGDTFGHWQWMVDSAIANFEAYFTNHPDHAAYIWGFNLITEDPATYRGDNFTPPWHGAWAAVDRVFTGHHNGKFSITPASHTGFRGEVDGVCYSKNRMIIAKAGTSPMHRGGYNIFNSLPDIDAFVIYSHGWCHADWNYGEQVIFDNFLYGDNPAKKNGRHNVALYFKNYGNTSGGPTGQMRRWIPALCLEWQIDSTSLAEGSPIANARRPCPPEIRCATYLVLSRGAKGILFHPWTYSYPDPNDFDLDPTDIQIPCSDPVGKYYNLGLRDQKGYPFGEGGPRSGTHKLNGGAPYAAHWSHAKDTTYRYLANTLIPEIKCLTPWLVNLTWINAYSRNKHNESQFEPSCQYIEMFNTSPIKFPPEYVYIDIGFFTDDEDRDYYMSVNREKIATNTSYPIKIIFDETKTRKKSGVIWLTDLSDTTVFAVPSGSYQVTMWYAPGEGRLYGVGWDFGAPKDPKLGVAWVPLKGSQNGPMSPLRDPDPEDPDPSPWPYTANLAWYFYSGSWEFEGYNVYRRKVPNDYDNFWSNCSDPHEYQKSCHDDSVYWTGEVGNWYLNAYVRRDEGTPQVTLTSNGVTKVCPGEPPEDTSGGCPALYSYWKYLDATGIYMFRQENTILPHSEHGDSIGLDLLALNYPIPDFNGHYYLNISEDHNETSYLDQIKLWVVDHSEESKVGTTADGEILVYSDVAFPYTCHDQNLASHRSKMLDPTQAFVGNDGDYLQFSFPDYGWESKALLVGMKAPPGAESAPAPKNYLGRGSSWDGDSSWVPEGEAYARHNPSEWLIDVSDASTCCFRLECEGDSASINYVYLIKLDTNFTITEAPLDSAVHYDDENNGSVKTGYVAYADTFSVTISLDEQLSLRFDQVDTSTTYPVRNFVLQSRGLYVSGYGGGGQHSSGEAPLRFGLEVRQIKPLGRTARINYSVPHLTCVKIAVYDVSGRIVKKLVDNEVAPGKHSFEWQGTDYANRKVASGTYFIKMTAVRLDAEDYKETTKIVVLD